MARVVDVRYRVGHMKIMAVYGMVDLPCGRYPGMKELVKLPVVCELYFDDSHVTDDYLENLKAFAVKMKELHEKAEQERANPIGSGVWVNAFTFDDVALVSAGQSGDAASNQSVIVSR